MENYPKFLNKTGDVFIDFIVKQIIFHYNITLFTITLIPSFIILNEICNDFLLSVTFSILFSIVLIAVVSLIFIDSKFFSSDNTISGKSEYMKMYNKLHNTEDKK